jgi:hypothetical protein
MEVQVPEESTTVEESVSASASAMLMRKTGRGEEAPGSFSTCSWTMMTVGYRLERSRALMLGDCLEFGAHLLHEAMLRCAL